MPFTSTLGPQPTSLLPLSSRHTPIPPPTTRPTGVSSEALTYGHSDRGERNGMERVDKPQGLSWTGCSQSSVLCLPPSSSPSSTRSVPSYGSLHRLSGGRREDTTWVTEVNDGRRRETSGERKWHAWAKGRRKWVKGGHFLGPVPPAGTAKGRDGTEEWRPVPHSSHYARRQAPASERSERCRRRRRAGRRARGSREERGSGPVPVPVGRRRVPRDRNTVKGVRWGGRSLPYGRRVRLWDGGERDAGGWVGVGRERSEGPDGWG